MCSKRCAQVAYNVGGEQSGHMILTDYATTGDGTIAALQVLAALVRAQQAGERAAPFVRSVPQLLEERALSPAASRSIMPMSSASSRRPRPS
jgi:phosphomannomutase